MVQPERAQGMVFKKIARRVEDILKAARDRERRGQHLSLEIDIEGSNSRLLDRQDSCPC